MTEKIMDVEALQAYLIEVLNVKKVKLQGSGKFLTIKPIEEETTEKSGCPFLGMIIDDKLTVDKFLEWKREEREREYERDLRS